MTKTVRCSLLAGLLLLGFVSVGYALGDYGGYQVSCTTPRTRFFTAPLNPEKTVRPLDFKGVRYIGVVSGFALFG